MSHQEGKPKQISPKSNCVSWTETLDRGFRRNKELRRLARKICGLQDELRSRVGEEAWAIYLRIEEVASERLCKVVDLAAQAGFQRGRRVTKT